MDLASPAVSGTSVYANGLSDVAAAITHGSHCVSRVYWNVIPHHVISTVNWTLFNLKNVLTYTLSNTHSIPHCAFLFFFTFSCSSRSWCVDFFYPVILFLLPACVFILLLPPFMFFLFFPRLLLLHFCLPPISLPPYPPNSNYLIAARFRDMSDNYFWKLPDSS